MRYPAEGYILLVFMVLLVDGGLYLFRDRFRETWEFRLHKLVAFFWYVVSPAMFLTAFTVLFVMLPSTKLPGMYAWFGYVIVFFLMVYGLKFFWLAWSSVWAVAHQRNKRKKQMAPLPVENEKVPYPRLSRRKFLSQVGIVIATAPMASVLFGAFKGRYDFYTRYRKLSFPNLPVSFERLPDRADIRCASGELSR
ncbi:MAG: hypothetical protein QM786_12960 [Breznakibacter sp.]